MRLWLTLIYHSMPISKRHLAFSYKQVVGICISAVATGEGGTYLFCRSSYFISTRGRGTVVPNRENPPNIMKFLTCYIIDSYWNSDLADSENGIFELFRSPNSAQKRSDFHLSALKILIFHFLYSKISMEGFKKVVFPNQRAPKSRIWVVQIKPYSILVAPETLHFWASANILRLLIELVFNFWQKLGIHFEFWTCWFDRIFLTFYFSSNRNV